jgi:hypothetical protein
MLLASHRARRRFGKHFQRRMGEWRNFEMVALEPWVARISQTCSPHDEALHSTGRFSVNGR